MYFYVHVLIQRSLTYHHTKPVWQVRKISQIINQINRTIYWVAWPNLKNIAKLWRLKSFQESHALQAYVYVYIWQHKLCISLLCSLWSFASLFRTFFRRFFMSETELDLNPTHIRLLSFTIIMVRQCKSLRNSFFKYFLKILNPKYKICNTA